MTNKIIKKIMKHKICLISVLLVSLLVYSFYTKKEEFVGDFIKKIQKNAQTTQNTVAQNQLSKLSKNTIGKPGVKGSKGFDGEEGTRGSQGKPGSTFLHKGVLRNLATNNFLDRDFFDGDVEANAFMNDATYQPSQYWRLDADNKLRNQYGSWEQCLATDGSKVYIDKCNPIDPKSSWKFNKYGFLKSKYHASKKGVMCLTTNKDSRGNTKLQMRTCDSNTYPKNQLWSFY